MTTTFGSRAAISRSTSRLSSGLPSLTKMISPSTPAAANADVRRSCMIGIAWPSL